jgi:hypothetical protein
MNDDQITTPAEVLAQAQIIVGPWSIAIPGGADGTVSTDIAAEISTSPARKLLIPVRQGSWEWAGVETWETEAMARKAAHSIKQIATGEEADQTGSLPAWAIVIIVIGVLILTSGLAVSLIGFLLN